MGILPEATSGELKRNICVLNGRNIFLIDLPRTEDQSWTVKCSRNAEKKRLYKSFILWALA